MQYKSGTTFLDKKLTISNIDNMDKLSIILAAQPHNFNGKKKQPILVLLLVII